MKRRQGGSLCGMEMDVLAGDLFQPDQQYFFFLITEPLLVLYGATCLATWMTDNCFRQS